MSEQRWVYKSYEHMYGGLHGMQSTGVVSGTRAYVDEIASEAAREVVDSYEEIMCSLQDDADEQDCDIDLVVEDDLEFEVYPVKEDYTLSDKEISDLIYNDFEGFVDEYCERERGI